MPKIFLIDDDPLYHELAHLMIKENMLFDNFISYTKAELALEYLIKHKDNPESLPDLILLDLNMPEMDGWNFICLYEDLLPVLKKRINVFIVTSSIDQRDEVRSMAYPFIRGFYSKPITIEALFDIAYFITVNSTKSDSLKMLDQF